MIPFQLQQEWTVERDRIKRFLEVVDQQFYEPLSQRVDIHEYASKLSQNAKNLFLIEGGSRDIAHVAFYECLKEKSIFISSIAIVKKHHNRGLGGHLLDIIKAYAKENNYKKIELEVDVRANKLVSFYKKNSFFELRRDGNTLLLYCLVG